MAFAEFGHVQVAIEFFIDTQFAEVEQADEGALGAAKPVHSSEVRDAAVVQREHVPWAGESEVQISGRLMPGGYDSLAEFSHAGTSSGFGFPPSGRRSARVRYHFSVRVSL